MWTKSLDSVLQENVLGSLWKQLLILVDEEVFFCSLNKEVGHCYTRKCIGNSTETGIDGSG